jgi:hypothetical protein
MDRQNAVGLPPEYWEVEIDLLKEPICIAQPLSVNIRTDHHINARARWHMQNVFDNLREIQTDTDNGRSRSGPASHPRRGAGPRSDEHRHTGEQTFAMAL